MSWLLWTRLDLAAAERVHCSARWALVSHNAWETADSQGRFALAPRDRTLTRSQVPIYSVRRGATSCSAAPPAVDVGRRFPAAPLPAPVSARSAADVGRPLCARPARRAAETLRPRASTSGFDGNEASAAEVHEALPGSSSRAACAALASGTFHRSDACGFAPIAAVAARNPRMNLLPLALLPCCE